MVTSIPPIADGPTVYSDKQTTEPVRDGYVVIRLHEHDQYVKVNYSDLEAPPEMSPAGLMLQWSIKEQGRCHAQEFIPMAAIKNVKFYTDSENYRNALDAYSISQTGMPYDEAQELSEKAEKHEGLRAFLAGFGINPDDVSFPE